MYFLSELEHKYLIHRLHPLAREVGVSSELRGWSWHKEPLKPFHDSVKLPMYAVCSKYCPTGRDVYLGFVEGARREPSFRVALGKLIHGAVSDCLQSFITRKGLSFHEWCSKVRWDEIPAERGKVLPFARMVWDYVSSLCEARRLDIAARQPYASEYDVVASAAPFLVEHKI
ncbi:MAG: CRISPR-associated protein Cas4, partial [Candidatus Freyarchaeota archaeon]|nr:CRISPR-associated protein Cas4 [Candidatus Jordarchaeia archaeon]